MKTIRAYSESRYAEHVFDLRWRMYWTNRESRKGAWCDPGRADDVGTKAWMQPKENLARAVIEGRNRKSQLIVPFADIDGQDFIEFRWISAANVPLGSFGGAKLKIFGAIQGMTLVSRNEKISVYINGNVVRAENNEGKVYSHAWKH